MKPVTMRPTMADASTIGHDTRRNPEGSPCDSRAAATASCNRARVATASSYVRQPRSVTANFRDVRTSSLTPKCFSRAATERLRREGGKPKRAPAALKPPASTTATNAISSSNRCGKSSIDPHQDHA